MNDDAPGRGRVGVAGEGSSSSLDRAWASAVLNAAVRASIDDGMLELEVREDGIGGADPSGRGLVGISDRVTALGGRLSVQSSAGGSTVLTAPLPFSAVPADAA